MSTVRANTYLDATGGSNAVFSGVASPPNSMGFRNRIINGDMRIDQRNNGASGTGIGTYTVDRWAYNASQTSKGTWQQNAGAVTPPIGFRNYLGFTSSSAYTVLSGDYFSFGQTIEGLNVSDFSWGTATAATITLSFWVRSSLTGTFGGALQNTGATRSYPFSYTISAANTWELKTLTIPGDTTGTWLTTNGVGIIVGFSLGMGSTYTGPANAWAGTNYSAPTGATSVVGTNGATFYITGVQLEAGTVASPFERRDYGRELMMCQRYYEKSYDVDVVPGSNASGSWDGPLAFISGAGFGYSSPAYFKATKRATPTITGFPENGGASGTWRSQTSAGTVTSRTFGTSSLNTNSFTVLLQTSDVRCFGHWTASAEL